MAVKRAFPWPKVVPYWAAQVLGAFVGGALVYLVYHDAISSFEAAKHITRGALGGAADSTPTFSIFATFPARDFGPRFFAWLAGWGQVAFPGAHGYFWVPIVGPLVGGVIGAYVYDLFVGDVLRARGRRRRRTWTPSARPWRSGRPSPTARSGRASASGVDHRPTYGESAPRGWASGLGLRPGVNRRSSNSTSTGRS